jgi:hypothetical protein
MKILPLIVLLAVPAFAEKPLADVQDQWRTVFSEMVRVHGAIQKLGAKPAATSLKPLQQEFATLRARLLRLSEQVLRLERQQTTAAALTAGAAGVGGVVSGPRWTSTDGKSRWADEAEFKESISGGPVVPHVPSTTDEDDDWAHPEAKFKEELGGGGGSSSRTTRRRSPRVEVPEPRVGKGAWENPDDWKEGL